MERGRGGWDTGEVDGTRARWMGRGQDMDELGQVGGHGWDAGGWDVGKIWQDMGEVGEVGGLCGFSGDA